ncbi:MAG: M28 family peptidase [Armatimonadota bacterium]
MRHWRLAPALLSLAALGASCGGGDGGNGNGGGGGNPVPRPAFDAARAWADLEAQVNMGPRAPGSPGHTQIVAWLQTQLAPHADTVITQPFQSQTALGGATVYQFTNVIGQFNMGAPGEWLALLAHFDTRPIADYDPDPAKRNQPVPGASDGASGVAVLLEVARALKAQAPPFPVEIIFLDAEDSGGGTAGPIYYGYCLGSRYFVQNMGNLAPDRAILLDMVGGDDLILRQEGHSRANGQALLKAVYDAADLLGHSAFVRAPGPSIVDDHLPFINAGIPAIDLIDINAVQINYDEWHTTADTPDNCAQNSLFQVGDTLLEAIYGGL